MKKHDDIDTRLNRNLAVSALICLVWLAAYTIGHQRGVEVGKADAAHEAVMKSADKAVADVNKRFGK